MNDKTRSEEKPSKGSKTGTFKSVPTLVPPVLREVGKLAVGVASVSSSSGSATGNPRNKVALLPGHSLMDWIRLGTSGKDLTGLGSAAGSLSVVKEELAKHSRRSDAWTAIRGRVYNITEYFPFHPGGEEELMKGAGIDATTLFEQIHPWVNYEQILQKCYVGKLVAIDPNVDTEALFFGEKPSSTKVEVSSPKTPDSQVESPIKEDSELPSHPLPRFDWIQKLDSITIIFYTRSFSNPLVEVHKTPTSGTALQITLTYDETIFRNEMTFFDRVHWPCDVRMTLETGKVELTFRKYVSGVWENYGVLKQQSKPANNNSSAGQIKSKYFIIKKIPVNYNTYLFMLDKQDESIVVVPVGKHIRLFGTMNENEISRSYTPVPDNLFEKFVPHERKNHNVCLMVKRYPEGRISRYITDKEVGDSFVISKPFGGMDLKVIEKRDTFIMLAGGTGITPMLGLLMFLLERKIKKCQFVRLLFYNRTEKDILFRAQLEELSKKDRRFKVTNVLSSADNTWDGKKGHINSELIQDAIQEHLQDTGYTIRDIFTFICGPSEFNQLAVKCLEEISIPLEQIHLFDG
ncbi:cytochrome b5 reductase 4 isoform X2 [Sitophilus oryzae]|uniref:Cytochrome b5 reductase 4 isoform X2 n=1 Tax=Sitophilus oryzae TaxID=7048 RepID=A0A6J2YM02_SITOR|nr:cytochrome b5 reductase 4 isoform X2 [Sitophilus oryzae]